MTYELTRDDKESIINNHIRSVSYRRYVAEMELVAENAVDSPIPARITELNNELARCDDQLAALTAELEKLG